MEKTLLALALVLVPFAAAAQGESAPRPAEPAPAAVPPEPPPAAPATPPAAGKPAEPAPAKPPVARGAVLEEVSGTVREVDRKANRLAVETAGGTVTLALDRNTMVYTAAGLGTVLDVAAGQQVRAGRNADYLAYWVQVRGPARTDAPATPAQGTGPGGSGAASAGESAGAGPGTAAGTPGSTPGAVPPGGAPPTGR